MPVKVASCDKVVRCVRLPQSAPPPLPTLRCVNWGADGHAHHTSTWCVTFPPAQLSAPVRRLHYSKPFHSTLWSKARFVLPANANAIKLLTSQINNKWFAKHENSLRFQNSLRIRRKYMYIRAGIFIHKVHTVHDLRFLLANGALMPWCPCPFKNEVNRSVRADYRDELCFSHNLLDKQNIMF